MSAPKQTTLFQTWGNNKSKEKKKDKHAENASNTLYKMADDEDAMLALALAESLKEANARENELAGEGPSVIDIHQKSDVTLQRNNAVSDLQELGYDESVFSDENAIANLPETNSIENLPGFDLEAGKMWIYPTNYPVRDYQFNIVHQALYKNTMVTLPTGLGKTFIAAVVMYNFYRWYPQSKIVFMAPTKPLVAQQIEACYNIMGIPQEDTAEMTGAMQPTERLKSWKRKRIFFLTPQVLTNDLSRQTCPSAEIRCLVIDEAHKALGNHAYCQVIRELTKLSTNFRVLSLSATPGSDIKAVQQVLDNLLISHIELRSEDSSDIVPYTHERKVDKIVVKLGEELTGIKEKYLLILNVTVMKLKRMGVLYRDAQSLSKYQVLQAKQAFRQNPPPGIQQSQYGVIEGDFAMLMSLYHGYELLQQHGLRSLYNHLEGIVSGQKGTGRTRTELLRNHNFNEIMDYLRGKFETVKSIDPSAVQLTPRASQKTQLSVGHPKIVKLEEVVLGHFKKFSSDDGKVNTRIMIFAQFRDSVSEITEVLSRHRPTVKVMSFIGQSSVSKGSKGYTQKQQLEVMKQFREGGYNTLVSTCVGEEGLDIGDVDLIICFDAHKSPIRLVQRMGRTGRKREGRIVMLVTEGKEEQMYNQSQYSKKKIHKAIMSGSKSLMFYPHNARMVPDGLEPVCHKMYLTVAQPFKLQNKSGKSSTAPAGNNSTVIKKTGTGPKSDGFLTTEELHYWNEHFKVKNDSIPILPKSKMLALDKLASTVPVKEGGLTLSLSEWMPWQNQLHPVHLVGHSKQTKDMVELMELIDVQNAIGSDEDTYGQEMRAFLHKDDIIGQASGIRKYCTPQSMLDKAQSKVRKRKSEEDRERQAKKRAPKLLPDFEADQTLLHSDEELPVAFEISSHTNKDNSSAGQSTIDLTKSEENHKVKKTKKKLFDTRASSVFFDCSSTTITRQVKKKKRSRCSEETPSNGPVIEAISNGDDDDFLINDTESEHLSDKTDVSKEVDVVSKVLNITKLCARSRSAENIEPLTSHGRQSYCQPITGPSDCIMDDPVVSDKEPVVRNELERTEGSTNALPNIEEIVSKSEQTPAKSSYTKSTSDPEDSDSPVFKTQCRHGTQRKLSQCSTFLHIANMEMKRVKTPPPLEEVAATIDAMDAKGFISPVDVLQLIDQWNTDMSDTSMFDNCKRTLNMGELEDLPLPTLTVPEKKLESALRKTNNEKHIKGRSLNRKSASNSAIHINCTNIDQNATEQKPVQKKMVVCPMPKLTSACSTMLSEQIEINPDLGSVAVHSKDTAFHDTEAQVKANKNMPFMNYSDNADLQSDTDKASSMAVDSNSDAGSVEFDRKLPESTFHPVSPIEEEYSPVFNTPVGKNMSMNTKVSSLSDGNQSPKDAWTPHTGFPSDPEKPLEHDSFYSANDAEDSLFAVQTPAEIERNLFQTPVGNIVPNTSQITFTQALHCVHDSLPSTIPSLRASAKINYSPCSGATDNGSVAKGTTNGDCDIRIAKHLKPCKIDFQNDNQGVNIESHASNSSVRPSQPHTSPGKQDQTFDIVEPQFDLGLDLGSDFEDEMVPPSPPATQPFSQKSQTSNSAELSKSQSSTLLGGMGALNMSQSGLVGGFQSIRGAKKPSPSSSPPNRTFTSIKNGCGLNSNYLGIVDSDKCVLEASNVKPDILKIDDCAGNTETMDVQHLENDVHDLDEIINEEEEESQSLLTPSRSSQANTQLSVKIQCPPSRQVSEVSSQKISSGFTLDVPRLDQGKPLARVSPTKNDFATKPNEENKSISRTIHSCSDSDDDQSVICVPKRKRAAVLYTPDSAADSSHMEDEAFKTPLRPAPRVKRRNMMTTPLVQHSSDEESPIVKVKKKNKVIVLDDHDDDDFIDGPRQNVSGIADLAEHRWLSKNRQNKAKNQLQSKAKMTKMKGHLVKGFIDHEAELSGDASTDEDEDGSEDMEDSFVNDATQLTQGTDSEDMHAIYMRSVQSPGHRMGKFKLKYHHNPHIDVFSQVPDNLEASEYQEDSFCVGDDFEDTEQFDIESDEDLEIVHRHSSKSTKARKKEKGGLRKHATKAKGKNRIMRIDDSSSEDEAVVDLNQEDSPKIVFHEHLKRAKSSTLVSSDTSGSESLLETDSLEFTQLQTKKPKNSTGETHHTARNEPSTDYLDSPTATDFTQLPSLKSRVELQMEKAHSKPELTIREEAIVKSQIVQMSHSENPIFSLGFDDIMDDFSDDQSFQHVSSNTSSVNNKLKSEKEIISKVGRTSIEKMDSAAKIDSSANGEGLLMTNVQNMNSTTNSSISSSGDSPPKFLTMSKEERIRLSKLKQEEFRKKLEMKRKSDISFSSLPKAEAPSGAPLMDSTNAPVTNLTRSSSLNVSSAQCTLLTPSVYKSEPTSPGKLVIFVDSKEINGAQDVVSNLRFKHSLHTSVKQLGPCDYIVSNRMAVERKVVSDFSNGSNKAKLIQRMRNMCEQFERPVIIVEKDRVKAGEKETYKLLKSKFVDNTLACLAQSHIKVIYSDNQDDTSSILSDLCQVENKKDMAIKCPIDLSPAKEQVLKFYLSIPQVSYITALNLLYGYTTVKEFFLSPSVIIEKRGHISKTKAEQIVKFLRHRYDAQMIKYSSAK